MRVIVAIRPAAGDRRYAACRTDGCTWIGTAWSTASGAEADARRHIDNHAATLADRNHDLKEITMAVSHHFEGTRHVRLATGPTCKDAEFTVDGHDIARVTRQITIDADADHGTQVIVTLAKTGVDYDGHAQVHLDTATHDALVALGWRPPVEDDHAQ